MKSLIWYQKQSSELGAIEKNKSHSSCKFSKSKITRCTQLYVYIAAKLKQMRHNKVYIDDFQEATTHAPNAINTIALGVPDNHIKAVFNTLRTWQNDSNFADDIFTFIFLNESVCIPTQSSLMFVSKVQMTIIHHWFR